MPWPTDEEVKGVIADAWTGVEDVKRFASVDDLPMRSGDEWFERVRDADVVLNPRITFSRYREFLDSARMLRMIQTTSIGYDHIDITACTEKAVIVCNVAEVMAESTAQHTLALVLDLSKNVTKSDRAIRSGGWSPRDRFGIELHGKTLGIIGLGNIGGRVAMKAALAFGMRVLAYDPYVLAARAKLYSAELVDLERLLKESDVVSVHCPLTPETRHLLGPRQLRLLKPTAIIVNAARGKVVDEGALIEILENKGILGAGLDVFEKEPLDPSNPLRRLENVVLTSHIASTTNEAFSRTWKAAIENVLRFLRNERPYWIVNPSALRT